MGTGRKYSKKPLTRPRKSGSERRRREKNQRARLLAAGVEENVLKHMTSKAVRQALNPTASKLAAEK